MTAALLVLRPEPGGGATAARARALGLAAIVAPLFEVAATAWSPPDPAGFDAVLLTSANAARYGGDALRRYAHLPVYAVGAKTGAVARAAGFAGVTCGDADGAAALARAVAAGARRLLHPVGRDHRALDDPAATVERHIVYAADPVETLPQPARAALADNAVALLHSPRAAATFRRLVERAGIAPAAVRIAAISEAALAAAGSGWREAATAAVPTDDALLAAAARLCD